MWWRRSSAAWSLPLYAELQVTARNWIVAPDEPVLVTGAAGFIGTRVVQTLLEYGFRNVRCFVRPSSNQRRLNDVIARVGGAGESVEIVEGNLLQPENCERAAAGCAVIFHLAAASDKSFAACVMNSALTTRNLLDAAVAAGTLKRFVNVSSFAVYCTINMRRRALLSEDAPLETEPALRNDAYGYGKLKQEQVVRRYHDTFGVPFVILRPGTVFGPGKTNLSGRIGTGALGIFLHMGGSNRLPLTYVENCAEAIVLAGIVPGVDGEVFNVVDDETTTSRRFLRLYKRHAGWFPSIPIPYPMAYLFSLLWERYSDWSEGQLPRTFNRRRCSAEWKGNPCSNAKLKKLLGWAPRVSLDQASRTFFESLHELN